MPAHLTPDQLETAIELQRKCWTHKKISDEIGVSRVTVTRTLGRHNRRVLKRLENQSVTIKAQHIAQLEWIAEEAARQWERSTEDVETIKTSTGGIGPEKTDITVKGQSGNPALLREARESLAEIRSILGIDKQVVERPEDDYVIDLTPDDPPHQADGPAT